MRQYPNYSQGAGALGLTIKDLAREIESDYWDLSDVSGGGVGFQHGRAGACASLACEVVRKYNQKNVKKCATPTVK